MEATQPWVVYGRIWRKVHVNVDKASDEILAAAAMTNGLGDDQCPSDLLDQIGQHIV